MTFLIVNVCALANRQKNYHSMLVPCHDTMPSFMIFSRVLDLQELKNQVSQSFRPSHDAQMFEFHSHFLHGTYKFTQRHTCDFSTNFGALEHVLVVQIWIMHIKCPKTQLMHKIAKRTRNNSKFKHDTHVLVACSPVRKCSSNSNIILSLRNTILSFKT